MRQVDIFELDAMTSSWKNYIVKNYFLKCFARYFTNYLSTYHPNIILTHIKYLFHWKSGAYRLIFQGTIQSLIQF